MSIPRYCILLIFVCFLSMVSSAVTVAAEKDIPVVGEGKLIPITTEIGEFRVWTKKVGDNDSMKVLLLHGGPGATHEFFVAG